MSGSRQHALTLLTPDPGANGGDPLRPLLDQARAGEPGALPQLLTALAPRVIAAVRGVLGRRAEADIEDVSQEALLRLSDALPGFRGESSIAYFASRIAYHAATDHVRRSSTRTRYEGEVARAAPAFDPNNPAIARETRSRLRFLLDELSDVQAETLILFALGHSLEEIAAAMEVPLETARSRLRLARKRIRERLQADPSLFELTGQA